MLKIAIIENYSLFCAGIKALLRQMEEVEIFAEAKNIDELMQNLKKQKPGLLIIDGIHSEVAILKQVKKIKRFFPGIPVLLITNPDYADSFEEYIYHGVKGFILGNANAEELEHIIHKLANGEDYFKKDVWQLLKTSIQSRKSVNSRESKLTDREITVLKLFSKGFSFKEIGNNLSISPRTVETHKKNILSKLKISTTVDMVKYALHNHIIF